MKLPAAPAKYDQAEQDRLRQLIEQAINSLALPPSQQTVGVRNIGTQEAAGAGAAGLGANCPATTPGAPYTWERVITADGSIGFRPIWK